ncbi:MAG: hypothetical protein Q9227_001768 [Pyrenula ochraceoflavens]
MKIIIVGAGLGGLSAAVCFSTHGHVVHVLESRRTLSPQGSGINIRPGAARIMHSWGLREDLEAISEETPSVLLRSMYSGNVTMRSVLVDASEHPDWGTDRQQVIALLYKRACEAGAKITFGATVTDVQESPAKAYVSLGSSVRLEADLVIAADGIRSKIRHIILSDVQASTDPILSETTFYGIKLNVEDLFDRDESGRLIDQVNINCWAGEDGFVVTRYNSKLQSIGGLFGIKSQTDQKGMWDENGDIEYVRNFFAGSCSELKAMLRLAKTCDRWKLAEMPNLPRWTSRQGRLILLGDSAHAMHPNAAQGFSQIVEDIGVLDYLISTEDDASMRMSAITDTWQAVRKPRVERIKEYAKWNTNLFLGEPLLFENKGQDRQTNDLKSLKQIQPVMNAKFNTSKFVKWTLDYDAVGEVRKRG